MIHACLSFPIQTGAIFGSVDFALVSLDAYSLASNQINVEASIKLADAFAKMPNLTSVK